MDRCVDGQMGNHLGGLTDFLVAIMLTQYLRLRGTWPSSIESIWIPRLYLLMRRVRNDQLSVNIPHSPKVHFIKNVLLYFNKCRSLHHQINTYFLKSTNSLKQVIFKYDLLPISFPNLLSHTFFFLKQYLTFF